MLEIKELTKIYTTKQGETVRAVNGISVRFPKTGMVFLLGKSGSGKSTLLNIMGGLDRPDGGEIIVDGVSSLQFTNADFDSYRNTYVGFVFQDFNILNEFTVGENIGLALQLQNKPNDQQAVADILNLVDLNGMENRNPRTLSGGQRQRVAIARALIKDPKIIFADEPTGALDSKTGEQVLNTLKKLSETRLVVVVSHDRDFAERYGDRIIEISDGKIVSDLTKTETKSVAVNENIHIIDESTVKISDVSKVTESEIKQVFESVKGKQGEAILTFDKYDVEEVKRVCRIGKTGEKSRFRRTVQENDAEYTGERAKFIKSKLPLKHAVKLGVSSFKKKPIRLIFTILMSVIAFCVFGVTSTLMFYNPNYSISLAMQENNYRSVMVEKNYYYTERSVAIDTEGNMSDVKAPQKKSLKSLIGNKEIEELNENNLGLDFAGVFTFRAPNSDEQRFILKGHAIEEEYADYFAIKEFKGFSDVGEQYLINNGFEKLYGRYPNPDAENEIAISQYVYDIYALSYSDRISSYEDFFESGLNRITIEGSPLGTRTLTVTGIYKVSDLTKYNIVRNEETCPLNKYERGELLDEFHETIENGFELIGFVSPAFYNRFAGEIAKASSYVSARNVGNFNMGNKNTFVVDLAGTPDVDETENYKPVSATSSPQQYYMSSILKYDRASFKLYGNDGELKDRTFSFNDNSIFLKKELYNKLLTNLKNRLGRVVTAEELEGAKMYAYSAVVNDVVELELKGYFEVIGQSKSDYLLGDDLLYNYASVQAVDKYQLKETEYYTADDAKYNYIITKTDNSLEQTNYMLTDDGLVFYSYESAAYDRLFKTGLIEQMLSYSALFALVCVVVGVFAALMFMNFISVSISSKRKEIGILRAVGAGKSDIFRIFFTETFIIAFASFILAAIAAWCGTTIVNFFLYATLKTDLLNYGIVNILLIFVVSMAVSFAATSIPVISEARKTPVESIRQN